MLEAKSVLLEVREPCTAIASCSPRLSPCSPVSGHPLIDQSLPDKYVGVLHGELQRNDTSPICLSIVCMRRFDSGTSSLECTSFSTASTTPSLTLRPIAVLNIRMRRESSGMKDAKLPRVIDCLACVFDLVQADEGEFEG
jgi:hypothetical protein